MDLDTIKEKMDNREYRKSLEFRNDVKLMFKNCLRYNQPEHDVFAMAKKLETVFDTRYVKIPREPSGKVVRISNTKSNSSTSVHQNHSMTLKIPKKNDRVRS